MHGKLHETTQCLILIVTISSCCQKNANFRVYYLTSDICYAGFYTQELFLSSF